MTFTPHIPSLLFVAFNEAGMLIRHCGGGFSIVRCPWDRPGDGHRSESTFLTLTISPPNIGKFFCAACGHKQAEEVLAALPGNAVLRARQIHMANMAPRDTDLGMDEGTPDGE